MSTPWDIYAEQLSTLGYGYPLWDPEPCDREEVLLGDVGFIDKGHFIRLFNALRSADDDVNAYYGVPPGFEPLPIEKRLYKHQDPRMISIGPLSSDSIANVDVDAKIQAKAVGVKMHFQCAEGKGAVLVVNPSAKQQDLLKNVFVVSYIRKHHRSWHRWATEDIGLILQKEEIIFVSGWVKTAEWAMAAFHDKGQSAQLTLHGGSKSFANASFSLSISSGHSRAWSQHAGPGTKSELATASSRDRTRKKRKGASKQTNDAKFDQCVFVHYIGLKERLQGILPGLLPKKIKAAADANREGLASPPGVEHDDDSDSDGASGVPAVVIQADHYEEFPETPQRYDPLIEMLDYILEDSDAKVAVASTGDMAYGRWQKPVVRDLRLSPTGDWPAIHVDNSGLGFLQGTFSEESLAESSGHEEPFSISVKTSIICTTHLIDDTFVPQSTGGSSDVATTPEAEENTLDSIHSSAFDITPPTIKSTKQSSTTGLHDPLLSTEDVIFWDDSASDIQNLLDQIPRAGF